MKCDYYCGKEYDYELKQVTIVTTKKEIKRICNDCLNKIRGCQSSIKMQCDVSIASTPGVEGKIVFGKKPKPD